MSNNQAAFDALLASINKLMEQYNVPGVAVSVYCDGELYEAGLGVTHAEHALPVTPDTIFQIGSITKTYTAFVLMQLVEQGKLNLSDLVIQYVPELQLTDTSVRESVTVEQLLTHLGGWDGDIFTDTGNGDDALARHVGLIASAPQVVPNGTHASYNNAAFSLAGRVIEKVTGEVYESVMQKMVFEPLGLKRSYFFPADVMLQRFAAGHLISPAGDRIVAHPWQIPRNSNPAGGIACSIRDLMRYGQMIMRGGKTAEGQALMGAEAFATLTSPHTFYGPGDSHIALSWFRVDTGSGVILEHGGGTNGQISQLAVVPQRAFAFAMTTNCNRGGQVTKDAMKQALQAFLGISAPETQPVDPAGVDLSQYAGRYTRPMTELVIRQGEDGGLIGKVVYKYSLSGQIPELPEFTLAYAGKHVLVASGGDFTGADAVLITDEQDRITHLRFGGRIHVRA
jgi:CubicO group peptidase (beta-lactamase class C family)